MLGVAAVFASRCVHSCTHASRGCWLWARHTCALVTSAHVQRMSCLCCPPFGDGHIGSSRGCRA